MSSHRDIAHVLLTLTSSCNLACAYCFQNDKKQRVMSWPTLKKSLDWAMASDRPEVELTFFGGEPLQEFDSVVRAVDHVETHCPPGKTVCFGMITNGVLLDDERLAYLQAKQVEVQLSFDGVPRAQAHRGRGTYRMLDRMLRRLPRKFPEFLDRLTVSITLIPATVPYLADSVAYFMECGVPHIAVSPTFTDSSDWRMDGIDSLRDQFRPIYRRSVDHYRTTGDVPFQPFRWEGEECVRPDTISMCGVGRGEVPTVGVDGQVHACATFDNSLQRHPESLARRLAMVELPHLDDPDFAHGYSTLAARVRAAGLFHGKEEKHSAYGECGSCRFLGECGVCPVSIGHIPGNTDPNRVPDFLCAYNLVALEFRDLFPRPGVPFFRGRGAAMLRRIQPEPARETSNA